jgi:hypothetical protein
MSQPDAQAAQPIVQAAQPIAQAAQPIAQNASEQPQPPVQEAAALPSFLEPERGDGGQRWLDVNLASGEDIWSLFMSPSLNGVCSVVVVVVSDRCAGGYLGKSIVHFLCVQNEAFASSYPGQVRLFTFTHKVQIRNAIQAGFQKNS